MIKKIFTSLLVIYSVLFLLTFSIYNVEVNLLDKEIDALQNQGELAWGRIPYLQNKKLLVKPNIVNPYSIYLSVLSLVFEERKELSGDHVYRLQLMLQARKNSLRNIYFENLILRPKFNMTNGQIKDTPESWRYYLNFQNSDFQKSEFENSIISNLNLANSNFREARFDNTNIIASNLKNVNIENAILDKANFYQSSLTAANAKNIWISGSRFDHVELKDADFSGAEINSSSFRNANLEGTNFSRARIAYSNFRNANLQKANFTNVQFIYNSEDDLLISFKGALYNSKEIDRNIFHKISFENYKKYVQGYCNNEDIDRKNACINILISSYDKSPVNVKATQFPENFDYKRFDMIDISQFFEFLKSNINNE